MKFDCPQLRRELERMEEETEEIRVVIPKEGKENGNETESV